MISTIFIKVVNTLAKTYLVIVDMGNQNSRLLTRIISFVNAVFEMYHSQLAA